MTTLSPIQERYKQDRQVTEACVLRILSKLKVSSQVWYLSKLRSSLIERVSLCQAVSLLQALLLLYI